ncbi:MAG: hypothetical protein L3J37_11330 [Rhodobacteraceae bacterium]|nr:hypothetical protein [Paracoccaceae bacterium]
MSESDSFIVEVSEEIRREKLFKIFKKYAWLLVLVVFAIVGGIAYNEWNTSNRETEARLTGDVMLAAIAAKDTAALATISEQGGPAAVIADLQIANIAQERGDIQTALDLYRKIAGQADASPLYTDLAWLKIVMLEGDDMEQNERKSAYERLTAMGAPYRLLAQEQQAMQYLRDGDRQAALDGLFAILDDPETTQALLSRTQQLIVSLGGEISLGAENG